MKKIVFFFSFILLRDKKIGWRIIQKLFHTLIGSFLTNIHFLNLFIKRWILFPRNWWFCYLLRLKIKAFVQILIKLCNNLTTFIKFLFIQDSMMWPWQSANLALEITASFFTNWFYFLFWFDDILLL